MKFLSAVFLAAPPPPPPRFLTLEIFANLLVYCAPPLPLPAPPPPPFIILAKFCQPPRLLRSSLLFETRN